MRKHVNELDVIDILVDFLGQPRAPYSKIGDDVAYFPVEKGQLVAKSDMLVKKTDVPPQMKLWQVARKSVVACASDFAAKGVVPKAILISLGLPHHFGRQEVEELAAGFKKAKEEFSIEVVGGDVNECDDLVIDCTMIGFSNQVVKRSGASPGDVVVVTGVFGYSVSGLMILLGGLSAELEYRRKAISSVLYPQARLELGLSLSKNRLMSSSIDSSDGLAFSLYEIARNSGVGVRITSLPTDVHVERFAEKNRISVEDLALYGGEEYEIVATVAKNRLEEASKIASLCSQRLIEIGYVLEDSGVTLSTSTGIIDLEKKGWVHLK